MVANENGAVELYHDNAKQCETSADGLAFPSGKGINFSATSDAPNHSSELLDDYEEGTWTPGISFGGGTNWSRLALLTRTLDKMNIVYENSILRFSQAEMFMHELQITLCCYWRYFCFCTYIRSWNCKIRFRSRWYGIVP